MKRAKNILILGGYGWTGFEIAKLLLKYSQHNICLAGRDRIKAVRTARDLDTTAFGGRVTGVEVNAALKVQLKKLLPDYDVVISAVPGSGTGAAIAQAALETGVDLIDLGLGEKGKDIQDRFGEKVRAAGLSFISEANLFLGLPTVMARYAGTQLDSLGTIAIDRQYANQSKIRPVSGLFKWAKKRSAANTETCFVNVRASGVTNNQTQYVKLTVGHRDPHLAAAMAVLPCVFGLFDGSARQRGIHSMGKLVDPEHYLEGLWDMGMTVHLQKWPAAEQLEATVEVPTPKIQQVYLKQIPVL